MTTRQEKVNSLIQQEISSYLAHEPLEGIQGIVTITEVDVSRDLEHAKIYFGVIGQDENEVLEIFKQNIYAIQGMLNHRLQMHKAPHITFQIDQSGAYAQRIAQLIRNLKKS